VPEEWLKKFDGEIDNAMEIVDRMMRRLQAFVDADPAYKLVVTTALGQAGVPFHATAGFVSLSDVGRFMHRLGLPPEAWCEKYAMAPCKSVIVDPEYADVLEERLLGININDKPMLKSDKEIAPLSFDRNDDSSFHFFFYMEDYDGPAVARFGNDLVSFDEIGFGHTPHQDGVACTGRHSASGSMFVYDPATPTTCPDRPLISTLQVAPAILDAFAISPPPYMQRPIQRCWMPPSPPPGRFTRSIRRSGSGSWSGSTRASLPTSRRRQPEPADCGYWMTILGALAARAARFCSTFAHTASAMAR
jgi:hypothetical protein